MSQRKVFSDVPPSASMNVTITSEESKCPWGNISASPEASTSLRDIMSEQLASSLQVEEEEHLLKEILAQGATSGETLDTVTEISDSPKDCDSDFVIAQMLQMQFNKEYDEDLKRVEKKFNGDSKVSVSLANYMMPAEDSDSDDEDLAEPKNWDKFEADQKSFPSMPRCGYVRLNNEVVTKHDVTMSGRRNACRVMESFPPCIQTGDGGSFDMQLSNKVYNTLKVYSKHEEDRRTRLHDKTEKSTSEMAIDSRTRLMLYKLVNSHVFEEVHGILSTGKESVVLYAVGNQGPIDKGIKVVVDTVPPECAIKVFKTSLNEFKTRDKYIKEDYRFKDRFSKQNPRKIIHLWAEKEMHNLCRMAKAGIPCPSVVLLKKHILVLGFIGTNMQPAPKLKEVKFPVDDDGEMLKDAYSQVVSSVTKLYKECNLVHADLSEYNILWHDGKAHLIDVSQSVEPAHPHALEFLYRDCSNICNFFAKRGLEDIHSPESLFSAVSGFNLNETGDSQVLNQIRDFEKNLELLTFAEPEKPFAFDFCWAKSKTNNNPPESK